MGRAKSKRSCTSWYLVAWYWAWSCLTATFLSASFSGVDWTRCDAAERTEMSRSLYSPERSEEKIPMAQKRAAFWLIRARRSLSKILTFALWA